MSPSSSIDLAIFMRMEVSVWVNVIEKFRKKIASNSRSDTSILSAAALRVQSPYSLLFISDMNVSSFAALPDGMRLLALKRAEDGDGVILRMQETRGALRRMNGPAFAGVSPVRVSVDEGPFPDTADCLPFSTATFRYRGISIREAPVAEPEPGPAPAPVGSWYTGLITEPRACCGEKDGQLYLIWGQNREENLSHYELYRSRESGFLPERDSFLARVEPGPYRVGLYEDTGLSTHTRYFYRVRAVNKEGIPGAFSREFSGITREPLPE